MMTNPPDMKIRISAALRRQIEDAAKRNNRTMNGEISARLERSFDVGFSATTAGDPAPGGSEYVDQEIRSLHDNLIEQITELREEFNALEKRVGSK